MIIIYWCNILQTTSSDLTFHEKMFYLPHDILLIGVLYNTVISKEKKTQGIPLPEEVAPSVMTRVDFQTLLTSFQHDNFEIVEHLVPLDFLLFSRMLVSSNLSDDIISNNLVAFSKYLFGLSSKNITSCEHGYLVFAHIFEQLKFCKRYNVLLKVSENIAFTSVLHLNKIKDDAVAERAEDSESKLGRVEVEDADSKYLSVENKSVLSAISKLLKLVLGGLQHSPRVFLKCLEFLLIFLEFIDMEDSAIANIVVEIIDFCRYLHRDLIDEMKDVKMLLQSSNVLQRYGKKNSVDLQNYATECSWTTEANMNGTNNSIPEDLLNERKIGDIAEGTEGITSQKRPPNDLFAPPPWPVGSFEMETMIDLNLNSVRSCRASFLQAISLDPERSKPSQFEGHLIRRSSSNMDFPYEFLGNFKVHPKKDKKEDGDAASSATSSVGLKYESWSCPACTFRNEGDAKTCKTCNTAAPPKTKLSKQGKNPGVMKLAFHDSGCSFTGWYGRGSEEKSWLGKRVKQADGVLSLSSFRKTANSDNGNNHVFRMVDFGQYYVGGDKIEKQSVIGIDTKKSFSVNSNEAFSIELYFSRNLVKRNSSRQTLISNNQYGLSIDESGNLYAWYDKISCKYMENPVTDTNFHHLVLNWNPKSKSLQLYLNGAILNPASADMPGSRSSISSLIFGSRYYNNALNEPFCGKLCEVRVYTGVDDGGVSDILSNYKAKSVVYRNNPSLRGYWPLLDDGDMVSFLVDKSCNCNNASIVCNRSNPSVKDLLSCKVNGIDGHCFPVNGHFTKRENDFLFAGVSGWSNNDNKYTIGNEESSGSIWCAKKLNVRNKVLFEIKNIKSNNSDSNDMSKITILLQACSWWNIEPTNTYESNFNENDNKVENSVENSGKMDIDNDTPPAPQVNLSENLSYPSDELIAQFLMVTGSDTKDHAIIFLQEANMSLEQAASLYFDPNQKSRILSDCKSRTSAPPSFPHVTSSDNAANDVAVNENEPQAASEPIIPGIYIDIIGQNINGIETYSVCLRCANKSGDIEICASADNIIKRENNLRLCLDSTHNELHFTQYKNVDDNDHGRENSTTLLKLKANGIFRIITDAWFGMIAKNVSFDDVVLSCFSSASSNAITENKFVAEFTDLNKYFHKSGEDDKREKIAMPLTTNPGEQPGVAKSIVSDENTKNFMEITGVTDLSIATRWVKGNNNNAQSAILSYFQDPTKVPPAIIVPSTPFSNSDNETKTTTIEDNKENVTRKDKLSGQMGESEEEKAKKQGLQVKALKHVIRNKYENIEALGNRAFASGGKGAEKECIELWDTTHGNFLIKRQAKDVFVEILTGQTQKNSHNIYGYAYLSENVEFTESNTSEDINAKQIEWTIKGWWSDARSSNKTKNLILIKLNFETDTLSGMLFKGNSIVEWRGKRTMDYEKFKNSFKTSTGCCGLVNGKDDLTNICFQNSLLQSLYRSPEFRTGVLNFQSVFNENTDENNVLKALADLYASLSGINKPYVASHKLQRALPSSTFGSGQQQDVSEFWQYLSSEFAQVGLEKKDYDVTSNLFGCTIRNSMECFKCGNLKIGKEEPYLDIPLVFPTRFKAITDIKVVSGQGLEVDIPEGYERLGFNLNEGREDTPYVFLCVKRDPNRKIQPLSDITVVHCGSTDPRPDLPGWEFVDGNLNKGGLSTARRVYLAFKRGEGSPISNIDIVVGKDTHVKEGFCKINKDINGGEKEPIYICYLQDLPIRDIIVRDSGVKGYTFVDVNISPNDANQLYVCHTDQSQNEPITGIKLVDQAIFESIPEEGKKQLQVLSKDFGTSGKKEYLVATRGSGCPITEIHIFRAPRIRPKHGYPEYIDLVKSSEVWPQRLNGNWLSTNTKPRTQRDRARKKLPLKLHNRTENLVKFRGTYSGFGGGKIHGILIPMNSDSNGNTATYSSMCIIKGGEFKASQYVTMITTDNFQSIRISGTVHLPNANNITMGLNGNNNGIGSTNSGSDILFPQLVDVGAVRSTMPLVTKSFITDVTVVNSIENVPDGFTIIDKCCNDESTIGNLNRDCVSKNETYICVKRDKNKLPITDIGVVWGFEMPVNYGYEVVRSTSTNADCNLNQGMDVPELYLCTRRAIEINDKTKGLMDIAILRVGGVASAKIPEGYEKVEKSQGTMRHDTDLNTGNVNQHRLYLCKKITAAAEKPIDHHINATYESNKFGIIELYGTSKSFGHSVIGSFDPKIDPNARMRGEAPQYQGILQGVMIPHVSGSGIQNIERNDWEFIGRWKDSTTQHLMACSFLFKYPYGECTGAYSDGKEEHKWSFVKDDFIQMSFKKDYNCSFKNSEMEFGERCFRHDISNMVLNFFSPSVNPEVDCDTCQQRTAHINRVHCTKSPEHLMLTVKRMSFDWRSNKNIKSLMNAHFSSTITLPQYDDPAGIDSNVNTRSENDAKCRSYGLFAVIVHSGKTANSGHYYAYARSANASDLHKQDSPEAPWIKFNDMRVNYVENGFKGMRETISKSVGANAYILIYKRLHDAKLASHKSALPGELITGLEVGPNQTKKEEDDEAALLSLALQISKNNDGDMKQDNDATVYNEKVEVIQNGNENTKGEIEMSDEEALQMALALSQASADMTEDLNKEDGDSKLGLVQSKDINGTTSEQENVPKKSGIEISGKDFAQFLPKWYADIEKHNVEAIKDVSKLDNSWIELIRNVTPATEMQSGNLEEH